jgi:hypothetical protein
MFAFTKVMNFSEDPMKVNWSAEKQIHNNSNNSNKPFSVQKGWRLTAYGRGLDFTQLVNTRQVMGKLSKHGSVTRLEYKKNPHMFVMKTIPFKSNDSRAVFDTEIKVGQMKNINKVGTRVVAWRKLGTMGQYIMENVEKVAANSPGNDPVKVYTFSRFKQANPAVFNMFKSKFKEFLYAFHRITGGNHGDLHGGNILVVVKGRSIYIKIIDYGAFRTRRELTKARKVARYYNMNVYNVGNGQEFIYNANSLKNLLRNRSNNRVPRRVRTSMTARTTNRPRRTV